MSAAGELFPLLVLLGCMCAANSVLGQQTSMVTSLEDGGPGSLREQIAMAQPESTISFAISGTIVLTNGELLIDKNLRIAGPGAANLAISARGQSRVLEIVSNTVVTLSGLMICDGRAADGAMGRTNDQIGGDGSDGGGIYNGGSLIVDQCIISNCVAGRGGNGFITHDFSEPDATNWFGGFGGRGGAIFNAGRLRVTGSRLISNSSGAGGNAGGAWEYGVPGSPGGGGGAIYNAAKMILNGCVFDFNRAGDGSTGYSQRFSSTPPDGGYEGGAGGDGGAVSDAGQVATRIADCQFHFNSSGVGGTGSTCQTSSLINFGGAGGPGGRGGAIWANGSVAMVGCTFEANQTGAGGPGGTGIKRGGAGGTGGQGGAICVIGEMSLTRCLGNSNRTGPGGNGGMSHIGLAGTGGNGGLGGAVYATSALRLNQCTFTSNLAGCGGEGGSNPSSRDYPNGPGVGGVGGSGGALYCESDLAAVRCTVSSNQAGNAGSPGSGSFNGGFNYQSSTAGSNGGQGGGIFDAGMLDLEACTISGNMGGNGSSAMSGTGFYVAANINAKAVSLEDHLYTSPHLNIIIYTTIGKSGGAGGVGGIYSDGAVKMALCTISGNMGGPRWAWRR